MNTKKTAGYFEHNFGATRANVTAAPKQGGGSKNSYQVKNWKRYENIGFAGHLKRAQAFAMGSGANREMLWNGMGMMTKHQKDILKSGKMGFGGYMMGAGVAIAGVFNTMTALESAKNQDENPMNNAVTNVGAFVASGVAGQTGFRVGKELTQAGMSLVGARGGMKMAGGIMGGAALGAAGLLAVQGAFSLAKSVGTNDNPISNLRKKLYRSDSLGDFSVKTEQLQTSRQRALNKLSKSGLNDRGTLLGNESLVLKGLM